jgi:hypothetical protein
MTLPLWRDLALALLILEVVLPVLAIIAGLYFANRGLWWLRGKARIYLNLAGSYVKLAQQIITTACKWVASPVIAAQAGLAYAQGLSQGFRTFLTRRQHGRG